VPSAAELYDPRCIVLIPLRAGSGVRLRLLEAWAMGVPAVTTPLGGEGLITEDGDGAVLADTADQFIAAALRLAHDHDYRHRLVERGRERLTEHTVERVAAAAHALYGEAVEVRDRERLMVGSSTSL
jgi:glycosyltransferase involved in cell wall biosynthesis